MLVPDKWKDFELLDAGDGEKLERWKNYILRRPDPQAIWPKTAGEELWSSAHAVYKRSSSGGGSWIYKGNLPEKWIIGYEKLRFHIEPTGFKHTGIFPEQAVNWDFLVKIIKKETDTGNPVKVLNLFAYTGAATCACAYAGASVCHIDAAKAMVSRASENLSLSNLAERQVRFIVDDVVKFVQRESRRGNKYKGIIMDPPSYGRGPKGELWKLEDEFYKLVKQSMEILDENPLFFIVNSYTTGFSPVVIENIIKLTMLPIYGGKAESQEIGLKATHSQIVLPCGTTGRWINE